MSSRVVGVTGFVILLVFGGVENPSALGFAILSAGALMCLYALGAGVVAFVQGLRSGIKGDSK